MGLYVAPIESTPRIGGSTPGYEFVDSSGLQRLKKANLSSVTDPTSLDDSGAGYAVGSRWINTSTQKVWECVSAGSLAAVWKDLTATTSPAGSGSEFQNRASASAFGAVTGSGFSGGVATLPALAVSDLTPGRVPYNGTAGRLVDSSGMAFNGTTLTVPTIAATTFTGLPANVSSLNSLTGALSIAVGTVGTDFAVSSSGSAITLNLPDASATARGAVTTGSQTFAGVKQFNGIKNVGSGSPELYLNDTSSGNPWISFQDNGTRKGYLQLSASSSRMQLTSEGANNLLFTSPAGLGIGLSTTGVVFTPIARCHVNEGSSSIFMLTRHDAADPNSWWATISYDPNGGTVLNPGSLTIAPRGPGAKSADFAVATTYPAHPNFVVQSTTGKVGINVTLPSSNIVGQLQVKANSASTVGHIIELASSPSSNASEVNSTGTSGGTLNKIGSDGTVYTASIYTGGGINAFSTYAHASAGTLTHRGWSISAGTTPTMSVWRNFRFVWTSGVDGTDGGNSGNGDSGLARNAAGVLEINNGTAGTYADLKLQSLTATNAVWLGVPNNGFTNQVNTAITVKVNDIYTHTFKEAGFATASDKLLTWTNGSSYGGTVDTGLARNAAGVVEVNNGTLGTFRDLILRNLRFKSATIGTSGDGVLAIGNGTAPSTSPVDQHQYYSADIVAGNAAPHFRTEDGNTIKLYQTAGANQALVVDNTGGTAAFECVDVGAAFDQSKLNNNFASLIREVSEIRYVLTSLIGLMKGSA